MLCLKAEAIRREVYSHGVILPVNLGGSIQKTMQKGGKGSRALDLSISSSSSSSNCSVLEEAKSIDGGKDGDRDEKLCCYRFQLEQEVQVLQKQLQEEINLHMALANAVGRNTAPLLSCPSKLPDKAQELLANIAALEITVSKLEEELSALHFWLRYETNERCFAERHLRYLPIPSEELPTSVSGFTWEAHIASLRASKLGGHQIPPSLQLDLSSSSEHSQSVTVEKQHEKCPKEEILESCSRSKENKEIFTSLQKPDGMDMEKNSIFKNLWHHPNKLSEEMVRCMRDIFLCLSKSSSSSKVSSSDFLPSSSSPVGHLSRSSLTSFSDLSIIPSLPLSPGAELHHNHEGLDVKNVFDPYRINGNMSWRNIGSYGLAAEVSWMSVGKAQLEYAAETLKNFRFLVEQLAEVNPAHMNSNEKLAFWINLYNALIMHAYLAYGVPKNDIKLFSLMQKASYTVGGQSFSAADIEFVILKMKPPAYRPQIALVLALHKFKITEEHRKYSIGSSEPLTVFALSTGMYSSPAVRIFTAENIQYELQMSMRDYIQASIGINDKGKLLVPKLLHFFARGVVEDSLLVDWICRYLTPDQVTIVRDSTSQRKQRLLGVRSFSIIPFDPRFRYLFLPDNRSSQDSF